MADLQFTCPRCSSAAEGNFYGPCTACRQELRATMGGERRELTPEAFEPKMNVVPNHVATKE